MSKSKKRPDDDNEDADNDTKADILQRARFHVWAGEDDAEEIAIMIEEEFGDEVDEEWLEKAIRREFAAKRKEEKTWPKETDCDRLDRAFEALEGQGIIALDFYSAGYFQSDGLDAVEEAYHDAGGKKSKYAGHCFYTEQDVEGDLAGEGIYIGCGHLSGDDAKGVQVGKLLRAARSARGSRWSGTGRSGRGCTSRGSAGSAAARARKSQPCSGSLVSRLREKGPNPHTASLVLEPVDCC